MPWKRRRGCATRALALMVEDARVLGLEDVEVTTAVENEPSRRILEANGGVLVERFALPPQYGEGEYFRFRIHLK